VLFVPIVIQLALISLIKSFEARHTDLLSTALVAAAGVQLAHVANKAVAKRPAAAAICAFTLIYQVIYACGVLERFTDDTRNHIAERMEGIVPRGTPVFVSWYVPADVVSRGGFTVSQDRWTSAFAIVSDQHALRYLGHSGTFLALGRPESCKEIYNCWTEEERQFYQRLFSGEVRILRRFREAAWTPEFALYRKTMGSKWMFTADVIVFDLSRTCARNAQSDRRDWL